MPTASAYLSIVDDLTGLPARRDVSPAAAAAFRLQAVLAERHAIESDVHQGDRVAFISVAPGLLVTTDSRTFQWLTGERDARGPLMAGGPAQDPITAALRIAARYDQIMKARPPRELVPRELLNPI